MRLEQVDELYFLDTALVQPGQPLAQVTPTTMVAPRKSVRVLYATGGGAKLFVSYFLATVLYLD